MPGPKRTDLGPLVDAHGAQAVAERWTEKDVKRKLGLGRMLARRFRHEAAAQWAGVIGGQIEDGGRDLAADDAGPDPGFEYDVSPATGDYRFHMPGRAGPLIIPAAQLDQMLVDYTGQYGHGKTMEQVATAHGITRAEFHGIKKALGITKSSLPFTDEQIAARSEEGLVEDLVALKKRKIEVRAQRRVWHETEKAARSWTDFEAGVLNPFRDVVRDVFLEPRPVPALRVHPGREQRPFALVLPLTDLHIGKRGWRGETGTVSTDTERACRQATAGIERILGRLPCRPEAIHLILGGDNLNSDNEQQTTTRGTRMDQDVTAAEMWHRAVRFSLHIVGSLAQLRVPVRVTNVPGNHDRMLSTALASVLWAAFRDSEHVTIEDVSDQGMFLRVVEYGRNLIAATHGDAVRKPAELAQLIAHHHPEAWGRCRHRFVFHGHLHHTRLGRQRFRVDTGEEVVEDGGLVRFCLPSLAGNDAYHAREGYSTAEAAMLGVLLDPEHGWVGTERVTAAMLEAA